MSFSKIILALASITLFSFCAHSSANIKPRSNSQAPEWVNNPYENYDKNLYFTGVATGDTREASENNAVGSIAKIFKSNIRVDQTVIENFVETEASFESQSKMNRRTSVGSNLELKNIKIVDNWFSLAEGLYYSRAVLDRKETASLYQKEFDENDLKINSHFENYKQSSQKLDQYIYLSKAKALLLLNKQITEKLRILAIYKTDPVLTLSDTEINTELNKVLKNVTVNLQHIADGKNRDVEDYLKELIGKIGFRIVENGGDFVFLYSLNLRKANVARKDVTGYTWKLTVEIRDNINQRSINAFNIEKRTLGLTTEQAKAKIMRSVHQNIVNEVHKRFLQYISSK
jgi:hypothetical protein